MWIGCERCQAGAEHCDNCAVGFLLGAAGSVEGSADPAEFTGRYAEPDPVWLAVPTPRVALNGVQSPVSTIGRGGGTADRSDGWLRAVLPEQTGREVERWVHANADELAAVELLAAAGIVPAPRYGSDDVSQPPSERLAG